MIKFTLSLLSIFSLSTVLAQTTEFGPTLHYHRTAFQHPDPSTIVITQNGAGNGVITTETDGNIGIGVYAAYYTENTFAYIAELFYIQTSTPNYPTDAYQSINLIPSVAAELGNSNIYVNLGAGAGFLLNKPDFSNVHDVDGDEYQAIDFLAKAAFNFRIREIMTLDGGVLLGLTNVVDEENRFHFYLGARIPLNLMLGN